MSRYQFLLVYSVFLHVFFLENVWTETLHADSAKACAFMTCRRDERCMNRKFWCKNPPCPNMLYCAKTAKESLKGPTSCVSVRCSKGYICLVKVRRCRWDQKCLQQIARCVSEREYYDGPASCADFKCPSGHKCILRESLCAYPPCKLLKSCAKSKDVKVWHNRCRTLGCPSEYECFLRRPPDNCPPTNSCKHTPDCTVTNIRRVLMNPQCRGWVCPRHQECSAQVPESCNTKKHREHCEVNRVCHGPLAVTNIKSSTSARITPRAPDSFTNIRQTNDSKVSSINATDSRRHEPDPHSVLPTIQTTTPIIDSGMASTSSQTECDQNQTVAHDNWGVQLEKWSPLNGSIYRTPVYVRSTVNRQNPDAEGLPVEERAADNTITHWLDYLRLKTGVDAINVWAMHAEEDKQHRQFTEWLAAVKTILGPFRYEIWLKEIKKLTADYPAFQKWLLTTDLISSTTTMIPEIDRNQTKLDNEQINETTENSGHNYKELTDFYSNTRSPNEGLTFSVDRPTPNQPPRQNAGHPRINYGRNRGYKHHRSFGPRELKNGTIHRYPSHPRIPQRKTHYSDSPNERKRVENNPTQGDPAGLLMQHHAVNNSFGTDQRQNDNATSLDEERHGVNRAVNANMNGKVQVSLNNFGKKMTDDIRNQTEDHPSSIFNTVENHDRNLSGDTAGLLEKEENLTKIYNLFAPAEDGLRVILPWDGLRVVDHEKKTYYTLMGFPPETGNNRVRIIGYPVIVTKGSSTNLPNVSSQNREDLVDTLSSFKSDTDPRILNPLDGWSRILQQQFNPSVKLNADHSTSQKQKQEISLRKQQSQRRDQDTEKYSNDVPKSTTISTHNESQYQRVSSKSPERVPAISQVFNFSNDSYDPARSSEKYHEEYLNAYIDALIEQALSKMIINEQMQKDKNPGNWKSPNNFDPFSQNLTPMLDARIPGESLRGVQTPEIPDQNYNNDSNISHGPEIVQSMNDLISTTPIPNLSSVTGIDYLQYGCEDYEINSHKITENVEKKGSAVEEGTYDLSSADDEIDEYYSQDSEQQEYIEGPLIYQNEYPEEDETNSSYLDFQYYSDEE